MPRLGALLDACVLVPINLADTLLSLAESGLFHPVWSDSIVQETSDALKRIYPDKDPTKFETRLKTMGHAFPEASIAGWEPLEIVLKEIWPDPKDAHVVAAAVKAKADFIVTFNLKDFPKVLMENLGLQAISPDDFLIDLYGMDKTSVLASLKTQAQRTKKPRYSTQQILFSLSPVVPNFAGLVAETEDGILD